MVVLRNGMLVLAVAALAACQGQGEAAPAADAGVRHYGQIGFEPCTLTAAQAAGNVEALCGSLEVAEDPANPQGRKIALNIAWLAPDDGQIGRAHV